MRIAFVVLGCVATLVIGGCNNQAAVSPEQQKAYDDRNPAHFKGIPPGFQGGPGGPPKGASGSPAVAGGGH